MTTYLSKSLTTGSATALAGPDYVALDGALADLETSSTGLRLVGTGAAKRRVAQIADLSSAIPVSGGYTVSATLTAVRDSGYADSDRPLLAALIGSGRAIWLEVDLSTSAEFRLYTLDTGTVTNVASASSPNFDAVTGAASITGPVRLVVEPGTGADASVTRVRCYDTASGGTAVIDVLLTAPFGNSAGGGVGAGINRVGGTLSGARVADVVVSDGAGGSSGVTASGTLALPLALAGAGVVTGRRRSARSRGSTGTRARHPCSSRSTWPTGPAPSRAPRSRPATCGSRRAAAPWRTRRTRRCTWAAACTPGRRPRPS
jgi:hypothetical protein